MVRAFNSMSAIISVAVLLLLQSDTAWAQAGIPAPATGGPGAVGLNPPVATGGSQDPGRAAGPQPSLPPLSTGGWGNDASPELTENTEASADRIRGFNDAVQQAFPMTPEMVRRYREIFEDSQRALLGRPEPTAVMDADIASLEPGAAPPVLHVAPGVASVVSVWDATGQPWAVRQYVIGDGQSFQVLPLGEGSNSVTVSPLARIGWTNLVLVLEGEPKPLVLRILISVERAHFRHDVQVLGKGPQAVANLASATEQIRPAGTPLLLAALSGVGLPEEAQTVAISGVDARVWLLGDNLYVRSRHGLLSPPWTGSMAGPDDVRVYRLDPSSVLLFSVDGRIVRGDLELP